MVKPTNLVLVIGLSAALAGSPADAQSASTPLTLQEAIRTGLARNPVVAAGRAEADASEADLNSARAARWPILFAEAGWHRTNNPVLAFGDKLTSAEFTPADFAIDSLNHPDPTNHLVAALGVNVPLFTSGRMRAEVEAADETSLATRAHVRAAESDLVLRITEVFYAVSLASAGLRVAEGSLESATSHERVAEVRFENGAVLKSDVLRARAHRLARQCDVERRRAEVEHAKERLRTLMGLTEAEPVQIAPVELPAPSEGPGDLREWLDGVAPARPEIEAARRASLAAEAGSRSERAALGPELAGTARYDRDASALGSGEGSYFAGLNIRWTAFDRGRTARMEAARSRTVAAASRTRAVESQARLEVQQAYRDLEVADRTLAALGEAVAAAEEARRISADRYASGLLPLTDLLDAETDLLYARSAEISGRYEAVVGRARLQRATGRLEVPR
jgi:outer membrane protein TolC